MKHAYLFGSMADGRATDDSDCDIAVLMPEPFDAKEGLSLAAIMERGLRPYFDRPVDLNFLNAASPLFVFEVIRPGKVLYSVDDDARFQFEMRARDAYEEFLHIQSFFIQALKDELAS